MQLRREKERFVSLRGDRRIMSKTDGSQKISFTVYIDESLVADLNLLHIKPSVVLDRELRREVRRRKRILKEKAKSQIVNRFSGQVSPDEPLKCDDPVPNKFLFQHLLV